MSAIFDDGRQTGREDVRTTDRRGLLVAGAAAGATVLTACTSTGGGPRRPSAAELEAERVARAEAALRLRSVTTAHGLLERYDATLAAHPALAARLAPLRGAVVAHAEVLGEGGATPPPSQPAPPAPPTAPSTATATATATGKPTASGAPVRVAADPRAALQELAAAERAASDGHAAALLAAPPEYARLLASVAASGAVHAYLLTEGARA
ncbi:hypothetical protein [Streptomyces sp. NPDC058872]|uniref:hypothetical protein n=1 Tax=Streptomyces sp. NPDC058872 TaxID=3346661 RepID=UPI00368090E5